MDNSLAREVAEEEAKRNRHWSPADKWRSQLEFLAWVDAQQPVSRNSKKRCLELQRQHDERLKREPL